MSFLTLVLQRRHGSGLEGSRLSIKRLFDLVVAVPGLVLTGPLLVVVSVLIKLVDGGPVFYRQVRVGRYGVPFEMWKFRSMVPRAAGNGTIITQGGDQRVTRLGRWLRKTKVDELPQLWNVVRGEMSLVGPRPEVPEMVEKYTATQRQILQLRPGITDPASLAFRHEEEILEGAVDVVALYLKYVLPRKIELNQAYARRANLVRDAWVVFRTLVPRCVGIGLFHVVAVAGSLEAAFWLGKSFEPDWDFGLERPVYYLWLIPLQAAGLFRRRWLSDLEFVTEASYVPETAKRVLLFLVGILLAGWVTRWEWLGPANIMVLEAMILILLMLCVQVVALVIKGWVAPGRRRSGGRPRRIGIVGTNAVAAWLAMRINGRNDGACVVGFYDAAAEKWKRTLDGVPILGAPEALDDRATRLLDEVIVTEAGPGHLSLDEWRRRLELDGVQVLDVSGLAEFFEPTEARSGRGEATRS